jgi:hypothetical protein
MTSKTRPAVLDFTNDEHLVLSHWFDVAPDVEASETPELAIALDRMGFSEHVLDLYNRQQAAVASILLERIDRRLPQWSAVGPDGTVRYARKLRDRSTLPNRRVLASIRYLFTLNWATSGPGFSWPTAYHLVWVPTYERFVVTDSRDNDEVLGYSDFALGHFPTTSSFIERAGEVIRRNWEIQRDMYSQDERWEALFDTGLLDAETVEQWAEIVWPALDEEDEDQQDVDFDTADAE